MALVLNRLINKYVIGIFTCTIFFSCQFELEEVYFAEVEEPDFSDLAVYLNSESNDLLVYKPTTFNFLIDDVNSKVFEVKVLIDSVELVRFSQNLSDTLSFYVDPTRYGNGTYKVSIQILARPNNGSLGQQLGYEAYLLWRDWDMEIDMTPPDPVEIDTIYVRDGTLRVEWKTPSKLNFDNYNLNHNVRGSRISKVKNSSDYYNFLSGTTTLRVDIESPYFYVRGIEREFTFVDDWYSISLNESNDIFFNWRQPVLYKNFGRLSLRDDDVDFLHLSNEISGSFLVREDLNFGEMSDISFTVAFQNSDGMLTGSAKDYYEKIGIGGSIPRFYKVAFDPVNSNYYSISDIPSEDFFAIYKYNIDLDIIDLIKFSRDSIPSRWGLSISPDGEKIGVFTRNLQFIEISSETMKVIRQVDIGELIDYDTWFVSLVEYSSDSKVLFRMYERAVVVDLNQLKVIYYTGSDILGTTIDISQNGEYLFDRGSFYKYTDDQFVLDFSANDAEQGIFLSNSEFLSVLDASAQIIELTTSEVSKELNFPEWSRITGKSGFISEELFLDLERGWIITSAPDNLIRIYNISTGNLLDQFAFSGVIGSIEYLNGYFLHNSGQALRYE